MRQLLLLFTIHFLFLGIANCHAQNFPLKKYPRNYFRNPLNIPMQLSANFGELRKDHFHMGLDIRTDKKENLPVFAAAAGYISRVKIERFGYGRVIYITHPNGYTTLYAHLNNFYDTLNRYIKAVQYKEQKWEQDISFTSKEFPVNKGQFIAYSGNTGGSQGPHLHFEIRENYSIPSSKGNTGESWQRNINPLLFDFGIVDNIAPRIDELYWYDRRYSTYETGTNNIALVKTKNGFTSKDSIVEVGTNKISFGISAEDRTSSSPYYFGIYSSAVFMDSILQNAFQLNTIRTDYTGFVNACIDYPFYIDTKNKVQHISPLRNNALYEEFMPSDSLSNDTYTELKDTQVHQISVVVKDIAGNASTINFLIRYNPALQKDSASAESKYGLHGTLAYYPNISTDTTVSRNMIYPGRYTLFDNTHISITQQPKTGFPYASNMLTVGSYRIPVQEPYGIMIVLDSIAGRYPDKLVIQAKSPVSYQAKKVEPSIQVFGNHNNNRKDTCRVTKTSLSMFGNIQILIDTIAPTIAPVDFPKTATFSNEKEIVFKVTDDLTEIKKFKAMLDGQWLMFSRKDNYYIYTFDEHCTLGTHQLSIYAEDAVGNATEECFTFTKELPKPNKSKKQASSKKKKHISTKKKKK